MSTSEIRRLEAVQQFEAGIITQAEAAKRLGLHIRQVKRLVRAYRQGGPAGLISKRRGRPPNNRLDPALIQRALERVRLGYHDFGPTLASEMLLEHDGIMVRRETLRKAMIAAGLWNPDRKGRVQIHRLRERRAQLGELIQGDGSPHDWFEGRGPRCSFLALIDDATSRLMAGLFAPRETTEAYFALMNLYLTRYGKPLALYVDKHSIFRTTRTSRVTDEPTQFARAMAELDIELVCANSPQAKGRIERLNRTLQDRLVKELRLNQIDEIESANLFLPTFLEKHNRNFAVPARSIIDAHRPLTEDLIQILCSVSERTITRDLIVTFESERYQIIAPGCERRLQHAKVHVRKNERGLVIEHCNKPLEFLLLPDHQPKVIDSKELAVRATGSSKARVPASTHPWKAFRQHRPSSGDGSGWRPGATNARQ